VNYVSFNIVVNSSASFHLQVSVEAGLDHPFFVCGLGWSSCCPERTLRRYGLVCRRLAIGDTCVSLLRQRRQRAAPHRPRVSRAAEETTNHAAPSPSPTSSAPCVSDRPSTRPSSGGASPPTLSAAVSTWSSDHEPRTPEPRGMMRTDKDNRLVLFGHYRHNVCDTSC